MFAKNTLIEITVGQATGQIETTENNWTATIDNSMELPSTLQLIRDSLLSLARAYSAGLDSNRTKNHEAPSIEESTQIQKNGDHEVQIRRIIRLISFPEEFFIDRAFEALVTKLKGSDEELNRLTNKMIKRDPKDGSLHSTLGIETAEAIRKQHPIKKLAEDTTIIFHDNLSEADPRPSNSKTVTVSKGPLRVRSDKPKASDEETILQGTLSFTGLLKRKGTYYFEGKLTESERSNFICCFDSQELRMKSHSLLCDALKVSSPNLFKVKLKRREVPRNGAAFDVLECEPLTDPQLLLGSSERLGPV